MSTDHALVQATIPKRERVGVPVTSPSTEAIQRPDLVTGLEDIVSIATKQGESYLDYLKKVMNPSYRDPPLGRPLIREEQPRPATPLAVLPKSESLFLPDDDEIHELPGNPWTIFRPPTPLANTKPSLKRSPPGDDNEEIAYLGANVPLDGRIDLGPPVKRRRRRIAQIEDEGDPHAPQQGLQVTRVEDDETPIREIEVLRRGCQACGCFCGNIGAARSGSGSGSTTLSPRVLGEILHMLMGSGQSLLTTASRTIPGINSWADIAQMVGARREDFDRVRHAASGMQRTLPGKRSRGEL